MGSEQFAFYNIVLIKLDNWRFEGSEIEIGELAERMTRKIRTDFEDLGKIVKGI